jgi:nitroimidazol reductase NimA-like FMN-containing flavoprotein (pyridoxamine 5'-phosphate oxidase superfamily)
MARAKAVATNPSAPREVPGQESAALRTPADGVVLMTLNPAECFELLGSGGIGRIGVAGADGVTMLPVNFSVVDKAIIFRTAPDTLLAAHANTRLSFEADQFDEALREGWSVLVRGYAHRITSERQVKRFQAATRLEPWAPGARDVYVRITPIQISGRRIKPS